MATHPARVRPQHMFVHVQQSHCAGLLPCCSPPPIVNLSTVRPATVSQGSVLREGHLRVQQAVRPRLHAGG